MYYWLVLCAGVRSLCALIRGLRSGDLPAAKGTGKSVKREDDPVFFGVWFGIFPLLLSKRSSMAVLRSQVAQVDDRATSMVRSACYRPRVILTGVG